MSLSIALGAVSFPAAAADVIVAVEPVRVEYLEQSFIGDDRQGLEFSGTWRLSDTLDLRVAWQDAQTPLRPVVSSPFFREYSAHGYSFAVSGRAFGPFELYGRVDVLDVDVATSNLKLTLRESRSVTIAGASARWRPRSDSAWGLEAGANRASDRPTFVGVGIFIDF